MNYYPYFTGIPYMNVSPINSVARTGALRSIFGNIKWGSILSGTQKALGVVNQAIPLIKQAGPVLNNAKTMFRVMNEFKKVDTPNTKIETSNELTNYPKTSTDISNGPTFFQ